MTDKEFEALEQQYEDLRNKVYEERHRREQLEKTKQQLDKIKNVFQNDWYNITDIVLAVRVSYCLGQDGNTGYKNETLKLEIEDKYLFEKCITQYINSMQKQINDLTDK